MADHGTYDDSIREAMADLTNGHSRNAALERALATVTTSAVGLVDGVDFADVMVIREGRAQSVSATVEPMLAELDAVQITLRQGPCLEAAVGGAMIRCTDLREDSRWPGYAAAAVAAGVHSMLSFQLATGPHGVGALNMFGLDPRDVDPAAEAIGALLATVATVALMTTARREGQFEVALASRDVIGQAKGILMNHFKVDATRAFEMLKSVSQNENTPLRSVAQQIIDRF
ncbi:GAF and ANTAR domain-containing protein [Mycobacterium hodleri]|uniref:GAF and ANTAR domain-containing protein n=1 Tax=Mycolicibacterium hodleri TaxID=49897 RepID=UPI0021F3B513|nr:GAF and ANTAR domain-containing protein [Mycolicibacterium hodleri]MCV7137275.1 GAF and ANTAR domain-containing protein [Mycolicibacterium hodleri]